MRSKSLVLAVACLTYLVAFGVGMSQAATSSIALTPDPLDFGHVTVGSTSLLPVTVTNTSGAPIEVADTDPISIAEPFFADDQSAPNTPRSNACWYRDGTNAIVRVPLPPGSTCQLYYRFNPTSVGSVTASSDVSVFDDTGVTQQHQTVSLSGTGDPAPAPATKGAVTLAPTSVAFGAVLVDDTAVRVVKVTNNSNGDVQIKGSYPSPSPYGDDPTHVGGDCYDAAAGTAVVLGVGDSCNVRPRFSPDRASSPSANLTLQVIAAAGQPGGEHGYLTSTELIHKTVQLTGTGVVPTYTFSPSSLAFGNITVGNATFRTVSIKNTSPTALQFVPAYPAGAPYRTPPGYGGSPVYSCVTGDSSGPFIDPGASCTLEVAFAPTQVGSANITIKVSVLRRGPDSPVLVGSKTIAVTGAGIAPTSTLTPTSLAYSTVAAGTTKVLKTVVKNTSQISLFYVPVYPDGSPFSTAPDPDNTDPNACNPGSGGVDVVGAGQSCNLSIAFSPTGPGKDDTTIGVQVYQWVGSFGIPPQVGLKVLRVTATGATPAYTFTPSSLAFGNVTVGSSKTLTTVVKNTSSEPLNFSPSFPDGSPYQVIPGQPFQATDNCVPGTAGTAVVAAGGSCTLVLEFDPASLGAADMTVAVDAYPANASGGGSLGSRTFAVSGAGIAPDYTLTPGSLGFGSVTAGTSKTLKTVVKNNSPFVLFFVPVYPDGSPYRTAPDPQNTDPKACNPGTGGVDLVGPGESCDLSIAFAPTSIGTQNASIAVQAYHYEGTGQIPPLVGSKVLRATGAGVLPTYTFTPASLAFGNVTENATKTMTTVVKNTSTEPLSFSPEIPAGAPYTVDQGPPLGPTDNCFASQGLQVPPGGTCRMVVQFAPVDGGATKVPIAVHAFRNDGQGADSPDLGSRPVVASGTGIAPTYTFSPSSLAFGTVRVGMTKVMNVVIKNTSMVALYFGDSYPAGSGFDTFYPAAASTSDCEASGRGAQVVQPGSSCTLRVQFAPTVKGASSISILIDVARPSGEGSIDVGQGKIAASGTGG